MRFADILRLAFSALWQQKTRTLLTTLGVMFGSFVLAASLSINHGVQETIGRETRRSSQLRRIDVRPGWERRESDVPAEKIKVSGRLSDVRRERIRKTLVKRWVNYNPEGPRVALTPRSLHELAGLEHVDAVQPVVPLHGWAVFGRQSHAASAISAAVDDDALRKRLSTGRYFETDHEESALVTELLLYELGAADDAAIDAAVGKKLRLEYHVQRFGAGLGLYLRKPDAGSVTRTEQSGLDKIKKQLGGRLDKFDLTLAEREALHTVLQVAPEKQTDIYSTELTITGILRMPNEEEARASSWEVTFGDVVLPPRTAAELFFRAPANQEGGVNQAYVLVNDERNVKAVLERIRKMGFNAFAATEWIDRQRLMYLLIFTAMTCIAAVALLVAALGIANTMLMSVLERTREVGVMKAVGAGNSHIQLIFLIEGAFIGLGGGLLGLLLAWLASIPGDRWARSMVQRDMNVELKEALFVFPPWLLLAVIGFAVLVTTLAAVYPARRAAKVDPVTALRHE